MTVDEFFNERRESSAIKSEMISDYFWAWATIMGPRVRGHGDKIAYVDLYAGRGVYGDGTKSTPILILETAIENPEMHDILVTVFNDANEEYCESLKQAIRGVPGIDKLKHQPRVMNLKVGREIAEAFGKTAMVPPINSLGIFTEPLILPYLHRFATKFLVV